MNPDLSLRVGFYRFLPLCVPSWKREGWQALAAMGRMGWKGVWQDSLTIKVLRKRFSREQEEEEEEEKMEEEEAK